MAINKFAKNVNTDQNWVQVAQSISELGNKAAAHGFKSQKEILSPIANMIKNYADFVAPGNNCDDDSMANCLN